MPTILTWRSQPGRVPGPWVVYTCGQDRGRGGHHGPCGRGLGSAHGRIVTSTMNSTEAVIVTSSMNSTKTVKVQEEVIKLWEHCHIRGTRIVSQDGAVQQF